MLNGHAPSAGELASSQADDNEREIDRLRKRVNKLENTVKRLFQIMDAQIYPDEKPEDVS